MWRLRKNDDEGVKPLIIPKYGRLNMDKKNFLENLILSDKTVEKLAYLETLNDKKATTQPQKPKNKETEIDLQKMVKSIFGIK